MTSIEHLERSVTELFNAASGLSARAQSYYELGDNRRGNIAHDAAQELLAEYNRLRDFAKRIKGMLR